MLFSKDTSTHKIYKCVGGAENIHDEVTSNVLDMLRKGSHLLMNNKVKYYDMETQKRTKYNK